MHKKSMTLVVKDFSKDADKIDDSYRVLLDNGTLVTHLEGTGNLTTEERFNRFFRLTDPLAIQYCLKNIDTMIKGYKEGLENTDLPSMAPQKILYQDNSSFEIAFTDGGFDPHQRTVELLKSSVPQKQEDGPTIAPENKLESVLLSHYAFSGKQIDDALIEAIEANPDLSVKGIFAEQFSSTYTYGRVATYKDFEVYRPYPPGDTLRGHGRSIASRVEFYTYLRQLSDADDSKDFPAFRHLWHDKTTEIRLLHLPTEKRWIYVATGSLNASSWGWHNAETQLLFRFHENSPMAQAIHDSIVEPIEKETDYVLPVEDSIIRSLIARLTGRSLFDVPTQLIRLFWKDLQQEKFDSAIHRIRKFAGETEVSSKKVTDQVLEDRISAFFYLSQWYCHLEHYQELTPEILRKKIVAILSLLTLPLNKNQFESALSTFIYDAGAPEAVQRERMQTAVLILTIISKDPIKPVDEIDIKRLPEPKPSRKNAAESCDKLLAGEA